MEYHQYLLTTYASWLGKLIGIRLGAPVENWSEEKIKEAYGSICYYPVDYGIFAADDDSNGPLFFVRALLDYDPFALTAKQIGETVLNYLQEYKGFFWWGGVGVSTEHTAYENLKNGIAAPDSGSMARNGKTIAEQIGGQIFSDCWGYVSGANPEQAARLARMASSVTHDGDGIEGGIFVAVCIAIAYEESDILTILNRAVTYLNPQSGYYHMVQDILRFYQANPLDQPACWSYIKKQYGYDCYPGVCHIIPNAAAMVMAMCYGKGDFSRTLTLLCECGWDTDCNCGNVGSILGALVGLDGIEPRWITPMNDIVNASSAIGYYNIDTISHSARMFAELAFTLANRLNEIETVHDVDFSLPYATNGFFCTGGTLRQADCALLVIPEQLISRLYHYTYYLPGDLYDTRYDPSFSPLLYPGETVTYQLVTEKKCKVSCYAIDANGREYRGDAHEIETGGSISYRLPETIDTVIAKVGLLMETDASYRILGYQSDHHASFRYDLRNWPIDSYGKTFDGGELKNLRGFVIHSGAVDTDEAGLHINAKEHAFLTIGNPAWQSVGMTTELILETGYHHYLLLGCLGYQHYSAVGFETGGVVFLQKNGEKEVRFFTPFSWSFHTKYILKTTMKDGIIVLSINNEQIFESPTMILDAHGVCGYYTKEFSTCIITWFELESPV